MTHTDCHADTASMAELDALASDLAEAARRSLEVKVSVIRSIIEADEVEAVQEAEAIGTRLRALSSEVSSARAAAAEGVRLLDEATQRMAGLSSDPHASEIKELKVEIAAVEGGLEEGIQTAAGRKASYERDPVFMYLYRRSLKPRFQASPLRLTDFWLRKTSHYARAERNYMEAGGYPHTARTWLKDAYAVLAKLEATTQAAQQAEKRDLVLFVDTARAASQRARQAMVSLVDGHLAEYEELDRRADLLIAREYAAVRTRALIDGREAEPMPFVAELEQRIADFTETKRRYEAASKTDERLSA